MKIDIISFTENGSIVSNELIDLFEKKDYNVYAVGKYPIGKTKQLDTDVYEFCKNSFENRVDAIIMIGAMGIAVRAIADNLKNKGCDPAVIVIDDKKNFVIPVISGHIGGANSLSMVMSEGIGATPVITTATDVNNKFAIDLWAVKNRCSIVDISKIKYVSSAILRGETIGLSCDFPVEGPLPQGVKLEGGYDIGICISTCDSKKPFKNTLNLIPKEYVIEIQCEENMDYDHFKDVIDKFLYNEEISPFQIIAISSTTLICENLYNYCVEKKINLNSCTIRDIPKDHHIENSTKYISGKRDNIEEELETQNNIKNKKTNDKRNDVEEEFIVREYMCDNIGITISKINWRCRF